MKNSSIAIVDYGMGNLSSVQKALSSLGAQASITKSPSALARAYKIILPGVGAFGDAMLELKKRKLIPILQKHVANDKKFLGICLGLQLLFESSEESKGIAGLGLIKGKVTKFRTKRAKVPHMGWNKLTYVKTHPVLKGISTKDFSFRQITGRYYGEPLILSRA